MTGSLGPNFWRLVASSGLSNLGDGTFKVALPLVAVGLTRSPGLIAGLTVAATLPWLLFALPAGAFADRLDRRRVMVGADVARAGLLAALVAGALLGVDSIWLLYAVALCVGVAETLYDTAAQSILPQVVAPDLLPRANARLYAVELTANEFIGPALAGLMVTAATTVAFGTPAGLWACAVAALLLMRGSYRVRRDRRTTVRADIAEGLRFLWRNRLLRTLAVMVGVSNFTQSAMMAVLVLYVVGPESGMKLPAPAFGILLATFAAGSLAGSFVAERVQRALGRAGSLSLSIVTRALPFGVLALTANPYLAGASFFLGGATNIVWNIITVSLRQRITPDHLLGRVNSGYRLVAWGSLPLGAAAGGLLADLFGLRTVFAVMGILTLALLAGMTIVTDDRMTAAEQQPSERDGVADGR
ncbi:MFS transporter [Virgisporangium aurantiacum]|nr:MFS transporter [Virgisporangium aurantiacum]